MEKKTKKPQLPKDKVIVITIMTKEDGTHTTRCDHTEDDVSKLIGILEQVKYGFLLHNCLP